VLAIDYLSARFPHAPQGGWKRLCGIPSIGPIRAAVALGVLQTPHRFRTKRQLWSISGFAIETRSSADDRHVNGQLQKVKKRLSHCRSLKQILQIVIVVLVQVANGSPQRSLARSKSSTSAC
jgi:transposase